jgi:rhodanese-related sulfurtransferase
MFAFFMGLKTVGPTQLHRSMAQGQVITIVDVNSRQSWAKAHVPGAINLNATSYSEGELPADKHTDLVFYCSNPMCRKAPLAARRAKSMGYENVRVMAAGISGWLAAQLPTASAG